MFQNGMIKYSINFMLSKKIFQCICIVSIISVSCKSDIEKKTSSSQSKNQEEKSINNTNQTDFNQNSHSSNCGFSDDSYSATVDYYNPETGYSQTYNLDVEVQDCMVVQINFPKGGWLDEDHISATEIDEDGNATLDGENGKTYEVHIER